ncbi:MULTISPECIES: GNAT family N-acetyltransferase [Shewanella]|uniref:GNAT family N-acetyltransferase n=1 Tax=Shewanella TaxID=22 RepID=UPI00048FF2C6|nr:MULTISPECIES: GNAT family N-acetyltransferase [Shewanella]QLE85880.1 GNAT family N-acetyltransferase [Shewanella sp. Scap07]
MQIAETERLIIRQFTEDDIPALYDMNRDPKILTYIPTPAMTDIRQARVLFNEVLLPDYASRGYTRWAVEHKADKRVIGFCGPKFIEEFNEVELGYRYFPKYWGQGIGVEAANAALDQFGRFGITQTIALILNGNDASEKVAQKVGMHFRENSTFMGHGVKVYFKQLS